jgi:hypothetical protein
METIKTLNTYNTDTHNSWGIGHITKDKENSSFEEVLKYAIEIKAKLIVKPSRGKFWYIKGINNNKSYDEIKNHLEINLSQEYKKNSKSWLLSYN